MVNGNKLSLDDEKKTEYAKEAIERNFAGLFLENLRESSLRRMKRFYLEYKDEEILPPAVAKLPWTHNIMLIEKVKDKNIRFWYANEAANGNWSKVVLDHQIDMKLYERKALPDKKNNFKNTLIEPQSDLANDLQKDPYIFNLPLLKEKYVEKELEESMVERIRDVLLEFGNGFVL